MDHALHTSPHAAQPEPASTVTQQAPLRNPASNLQPKIDPPTKDEPPLRLVAGKKRAATATSRGVANLTPEQLAKKRANDREAQRAIRKRTKAQIDALQQRVQELTSQQPYQDLQEAQRQKEIIQAENEEIRRRLGSVMAILHPILSPTNLATNNGLPVDTSGTSNESSRPSDRLGVWASQLDSVVHSPAPQSDTSSQRRASVSHTQEHCLRTPASLESLPSGTPIPGRTQGPEPISLTPGTNAGLSERLGLNFLIDSSRQGSKVHELRPSAPSPSHEGQLRYQHQVQVTSTNIFDTTMPPFVIPIRNAEPTCPLDCILLNFLRSRQREAAEGVSKGHLVGPPYPSVSSLLNPEKSDNSHPLSKVFTDIISKFPDIRDLPEKVAVVYVMFLLMRWQIYPTRENYDRLPEWITPRVSQLVTPHPPWMDYLPWPRMRDRMIACHTDYDFSNWFIPYTTTLSINWPYSDSDALIAIPNSEEYVINPVFESHLRNLNNWSLGPAFAKHYPDLVDTCRIKTDPWDTSTNGV
ncbi:hypothetical protein CIHG_08707 [Coccidioides immitis H538.4]|uniref:BZIP transcription factor n=1 Tax=Coccidioides immitis H538.4 TaxID=396776 RepID=A0A0J8S1N0_COCIT|nr:hypothetical protein CIHG_08707 [Coccidioides immitis H538.4]